MQILEAHKSAFVYTSGFPKNPDSAGSCSTSNPPPPPTQTYGLNSVTQSGGKNPGLMVQAILIFEMFHPHMAITEICPKKVSLPCRCCHKGKRCRPMKTCCVTLRPSCGELSSWLGMVNAAYQPTYDLLPSVIRTTKGEHISIPLAISLDILVYSPRTQMTLVLIEKGLVLIKNRGQLGSRHVVFYCRKEVILSIKKVPTRTPKKNFEYLDVPGSYNPNIPHL